MGREVKRVHMDFDWYEKTKGEDKYAETWKGYILDMKLPCFLCDGKGKNQKGQMCRLCWGDGTIQPRVEPPTGEGWQIWEDVSEGSPMSPVFKTPEALAKWMVKNDTSITRDSTYKDWLSMMKMGSSPSMALVNGEMMSGVKLAGKSKKKKSADKTSKGNK